MSDINQLISIIIPVFNESESIVFLIDEVISVMADNKFNHYKWQRENLSEAPMDKRFAKNFEKDCKALLNHIKSELAKGPKGMQRAQLQLYAKEIAKAMEVPSKLAKIVGMNEDACVPFSS